MLLVGKVKRKASASETRVQNKTGLTDSLRSTQFAAVSLYGFAKAIFVSLIYGRLRLSSTWGCSDSKACNWQYIASI